MSEKCWAIYINVDTKAILKYIDKNDLECYISDVHEIFFRNNFENMHHDFLEKKRDIYLCKESNGVTKSFQVIQEIKAYNSEYEIKDGDVRVCLFKMDHINDNFLTKV